MNTKLVQQHTSILELKLRQMAKEMSKLLPDDAKTQALLKRVWETVNVLKKHDLVKVAANLKWLSAKAKGTAFEADLKALKQQAALLEAAMNAPEPLPKSVTVLTPASTKMPFSKPGDPPGSLGRRLKK